MRQSLSNMRSGDKFRAPKKMWDSCKLMGEEEFLKMDAPNDGTIVHVFKVILLPKDKSKGKKVIQVNICYPESQ